MDSGAAVSLIHLQAYKLMPDTLKTAITLPGDLETLTTADGSPMHIIRYATITLHQKPQSDPSLHRSRIIDDRHHIRNRLSERVPNFL